MKIDTVIFLLSYITLISVLIPIIIGYIYRAYLTNGLRLLIMGWVSYFIILSLSIITTHLKQENIYSGYIASASDIIFFSLGFGLSMSPKSLRRKLVWGICSLTVVVIALDAILKSADEKFDSFSSAFKIIAITVIILLYLSYLLKEPHARSLWTIPLFWISISKLFASVSNLLIDGFQSMIYEYSPDLYIQIYCLSFGIAIICNVLYGVGIWYVKPNRLAIFS